MRHWYSEPIDEVIRFFAVNPALGINSEEQAEREDKYGSNRIISKKEKSRLMLLLEQFNNPVIIILIVAAIATALVGDYKDTIVIAVVVVLNTLIGYFQERRAEDALKSLQKMASPTARVVRDGIQKQIDNAFVVCGDILVLESGMRVPADARLIESQNLIIEESMLTGESFAVEKKANVILGDSVPLGDRLTMVYSGTIIQKGRGLAVVTDVGPNSEIGKISENVAQAEEKQSPLQVNIQSFGRWLSFSIIAVILLIFAIGFLRGNDLLIMFLTSVGLAVSAIPEGLPVAVTITLSIGIYQMAKHNAIVKKLSAVETLGSTNVICTDKTGTLTKNQMTTTRIFAGGQEYKVSGSGYLKEGEASVSSTGEPVNANSNNAINMVALIGELCTETVLEDKGAEWSITGDPTEGALMIASRKLGFEKDSWQINVDIPFESENQLMAVQAKKDNKGYVLAKGAPEQILARCDKMLTSNGDTIPLDAEILSKEISEFSKIGLRVLALAYSENCCDKPLNLDTLQELIFAGYAGIEDAVRPEAVSAVGECYNAGVKVVMITGDHIQTARSVAHAVGIAPEKETPSAITGIELDKISDEELFNRVSEIDVYARVAPQHKFRIVKQLQKHNNVVAMTGDGVNDAPALKQADIGVAMGSGTDVAKDSAQMVLMDDNFATIVRAIRRGRVVLHNLQHILLYILSTSFGGLLTIAMSVVFGMPLPLLPAQLLWINLVTDGTHTFPLAFEKEHGNVMVFPPRKRDASLITFQMIRRIVIAGIIMMVGTLGAYYFYVATPGDSLFSIQMNDPDLGKARTIAFCVLALFQIWNAQNSRSVDRSLFFKLPHPMMLTPQFKGQRLDKVTPLQNPLLIGVMIFALLLQIAAVEVPFLNKVFDTVPLSFADWLLVIGISVSIIVLIEIVKFIHAAFTTFQAKKRMAI